VTAGAAGAAGTLLFSRSDVERLLTPDECISAVEDAFRRHALGQAPSPGVLAIHVADGGFHIKAAQLTLERPYFAAKANANFPRMANATVSRVSAPTASTSRSWTLRCSPTARW